MNIINVQIMWKEIFIGAVVLVLILYMWTTYRIKAYKKVVRLYERNKMDQAKMAAKKQLRICELFDTDLSKKNDYKLHNTLCCILASISFLEDNEYEFLYYLNKVKKEDKFEVKSFLLALYYRAKNNVDKAKYYYDFYSNHQHTNADMKTIMDALFEGEETEESVTVAVKNFKNPAIIKLFEENEIL